MNLVTLAKSIDVRVVAFKNQKSAAEDYSLRTLCPTIPLPVTIRHEGTRVAVGYTLPCLEEPIERAYLGRMKDIPKAFEEQVPSFRQLFPKLSGEELKGAEKVFDEYLESTVRLYERIMNDPEAYGRFLSLTRSPSGSTMSETSSERFPKRSTPQQP